jgi:hypothetical protein
MNIRGVDSGTTHAFGRAHVDWNFWAADSSQNASGILGGICYGRIAVDGTHTQKFDGGVVSCK